MDVGAESNEAEKIVNFMGGSWIIRRSKSHNGMPYYSNIVTKEAVWNLNDAEIERAKNLTKKLEKQMEHVVCPEPKDPPSNQSQNNAQNQQSTSQIYNNQIQHPFVYFPPCHQILPYGPIPMGISAPRPGLNSNVWAIPPIHPDFMTTPVIQQAHTSVNVTYSDNDYKVPVQNTSLSLSSRFHVQKNHKNNFRPNQRQKCSMKRNFQRNNKFYSAAQRNNVHKLHNNDLRNILSAKKSHDFKNTSKEAEDISEEVDNKVHEEKFYSGEQPNVPEKSNIEENDNQSAYQSDVDVDFFENKMDDTKVELNFAKLRTLADSNANSEQYIVIDKNILLNHLNFLNMLINSDDQCKVMVPQEEMEEIRVSARASCGMPRSSNRSRRAILFTKDLLRNGRCILGEPSQESRVNNGHILRCCSHLTQQNYNVVLLTNNTELHEIKGLLSIPVFTVKELKEYLTETRKENSPQHMAEKVIKISITNDLSNWSTEDTLGISYTEPVIDRMTCAQNTELFNNTSNTQFPKNTFGNNATKQVSDKQTCTQNTEVFNTTTKKHSANSFPIEENLNEAVNTRNVAVDAAVQTEILQETTPEQPSTTTLTPPPTVHQFYNALASVTQNNTANTLCETTLKKERRLNRSTSNQTAVSNNSDTSNINTEKKQFKWRKRRNKPKISENENSMTASENSNVDDSNKKVLTASIDDNSAQTSERENPVHDKSTESFTQEVNSTFRDIVEDSETSGSIVIHENNNPKVVIEETSTSGIISNTTSHADSESEYGRVLESSFNDETLRKAIMFEILDPTMEHNLKMRCDEWVSRFVQIMEEALTQVLQQSQHNLQDMVPAPWTLYEATVCIKTVFRGNSDVIYACNRLLDILRVVSNGGQINLDLNPSDYMEMYSYGVYLIDILQSTPLNCEDLQNASESLANLLNDIRNIHLDVHNDILCDNSLVMNHEVSNSIETQNTPLQSDSIQEPQRQDTTQVQAMDIDQTPSYNLRSKNKKEEAQKSESPQSQITKSPKNKSPTKISFIRNIDIKSNFFASLHLQKKGAESDFSSAVPKRYFKLPPTETYDKTISNTDKDPKSVEPTIIRKFSPCPEYEEKLRNKPRKVLDMDQLDYSEDLEEEYELEDDDYKSEVHEADPKENTEIEHSASTEIREGSKSDSNANKNFAAIFRTLFLEMKEAFLEVKLFCEETVRELNAEKIAISRKDVIREKAEKAYMYIDNLRKTLDSVLYRETCAGKNNIRSILKQSDMGEVSDALLKEYRLTISKAMDQAKVLLDALDIIKSCVREL